MTSVRSQVRSWVMLSPETNPPYTPLPNEQNLFTSAGRIGFEIKTPAHYPGRQQPFKVTHNEGTLYLSNQRLIYLPKKPTEEFKSFASQILSLHDSHVSLPMFSANTWTALCQPAQGGGIPAPPSGVVELKFTFRDGGALDFHQRYEQIRERIQQVLEVSGDRQRAGTGALNTVNLQNVNLEDLPAYREESDGPLIPPTATAAQVQAQAQARSPVLQQQRDSGVSLDETRRQPRAVPDEPPPGYEEAQMAGVQDRLSSPRQ